MAEADVEVVMRSIRNPSCIYIHQHLITEGIDVMELVTEVPEGWTFIRQLPEKVQNTEVQELIVMCFNHLSEAHAHMSSFAANMSSLTKIANPKTFDMVMKAAARLMIQTNIPECYMSLVQDPPLKTTTEETVLAGKGSTPPSGISCTGTTVRTHLASSCSCLAVPQAQVLQSSMTKEACTMFEVQAKLLSKLLSGKVYLGGAGGATKGK